MIVQNIYFLAAALEVESVFRKLQKIK